MKKAQSLDVLGESHLPDDLFTETDGLNGLLDTYPDLGRGVGVLDHNTLGDARLPPNLPDGVVMSEEEVPLGEDQVVWGGLGDLGDVTKEASLADLSWLEFAEQDPERLPDNPVDNGIEELEQAWGVSRRTDGLALQPNVDREAATYEASLAAPPVKEDSTQIVTEAVRVASRKLAGGMSFREVATDLAQRLGPRAGEAHQAAQRLKDDAGLIGKVYVRASDYPGCQRGDWTEVVRKQAAAYVVQKKACGGCVHAQGGACSLFKKTLVASVPWGEALSKYTPVLEATGRKVAAHLEPKEALRQALRQVPRGLSQVGDARPHHLVAADQVGSAEARAKFAAAPQRTTKTLSVSRQDALRHVARWKSQGLLTVEDADRLSSSSASGTAVVRTASRIIAATSRAEYSGGQNAGKMGYAADRETALRELQTAESLAKQADAFIREEVARREVAASQEGKHAAEVERRVALVRKEIDNGLRGRALVAHVFRSFEKRDRRAAMALLDPYIQKVGALSDAAPVAAVYSGLANDVRVVASASAVEAWGQLREASPPVIDEVESRRKLVGTLGRWVRDGLLTKSAADRLAKSTINPRDVLRVAAAVAGRVRVAEYSGASNDFIGEVSPDEAWRMLAAHEAAQTARNEAVALEAERRRRASTREGRSEAEARAARLKLEGTLQRWARDGLLQSEDVQRLAGSTADVPEVLRVAAMLVVRGRVAGYSGAPNDFVGEVTPEEAWKVLAAHEAALASRSQGIMAEVAQRQHASTREGRREASLRAKVARITAEVERGVRGKPLLSYIRRLIAKDEMAEVSRVLDPLLKRTGALSGDTTAPRTYAGATFERAPTDTSKVASGPAHGEADRLLRWARQQMSEGFAGRDLDGLLNNRFASSVRTAASSALHRIRAEHEGLAGHLYVDAGAYASTEGVTGCEKGALRHRANAIPTVLSISRCASCSLRGQRSDGVPVCSVYNKILVASAEEATENPQAYKAEMLRLADGTDADRTASLFANTYDQNEFNLGVDGELDDLVVADAPSNEEVGDVFFGGMEVE